MNRMMIVVGVLLVANGASASTLTRSLEANVQRAAATMRQEKQRYEHARSSYQASKAKFRSAKKRLKAALKDERREEAQLRAIEEANARYYEIPQYDYRAGGTAINWRAD